MTGADRLVLALASLRDSLARISIRADNAENALRATAQRLRCNQIRKRVAERDIAGELPPVPPALIDELFRAGGALSATHPDNDRQVTLALDLAETVLGEIEAFVEMREA